VTAMTPDATGDDPSNAADAVTATPDSAERADGGADGRADGAVTGNEAQARITARRYGSRWLDRDFAELIELLRADAEDLDIACQLGRPVDSIRRRIVELVPPGLDRPRSQYGDWLREQLRAETPYDWRAVLRAYHQARNRPYFDNRDGQLLRTAWATRQPLPELRVALGQDEFAIARHLLDLGLAGTLVEVVQRLGVTVGTDLDRRVRLSIERIGTAVHILIVDGLTTGRHVSVHDDAAAGHRELDRLVGQHERGVGRAVDEPGPLTWTLAERAIAGGDTGATEHDTTPPRDPRTPPKP
jgi:hypothetical protein